MASDTPNVALLERIRSRCTEKRVSGCWEYELSVNSSHYANTLRHALDLGGDSSMVQGHRLAYIALKGPIPDGYEVDHLCANRRCLNAWHLQAVPPAVNRARSRVAAQHELTAWWFPPPAFQAPPVSDTGCLPGGTR